MVNKQLTKKFMPKKKVHQVTPIGMMGKEPLVLPNHSGISTHPEAKKVFIKSEQGDQDGKIDSEYTGGGGVRFNFGNKTDVDLYMEIGAFSAANNIDTKDRNFKIFSTAQADIFEINATTGIGTFNFAPTITPFSTAGFIKNDTSGVLSGGNVVDISADTNLAVTSPVTLTGDTLSFDFSTNNTWTGTNTFNDDVTIGNNSELKGGFDTFTAWNSKTSTADTYAFDGQGRLMDANHGWVMPHAGSIVSIGWTFTWGGSLGSTWTAYVKINGNNKIGTSFSSSLSGPNSSHTEAARGTHTFNAGDILTFFFDKDSGLATFTNAIVHCRVQYDA